MGKNITYVIGHKNPDTDSIVSALAYAEFKKKRGYKNIVAARAGVLNQQTEFILNKLKVEPPIYISDLKIKVADIMKKRVITIKENEPLNTALLKFRNNEIRFLPVINDNKKVVGILTLSLVTDNLLKLFESSRIYSSISLIHKVIGGEIFNIERINKDEFFKAEVLLTTGTFSSFKNVLNQSELPKIVVTDDREDIINKIISNNNVKLIMFSDKSKPDIKILKKAEKHNVVLIYTNYNTTKITFLLKQTIPVSIFYSKEFKTVTPEKSLEEVKELMSKENLKGIIVVDEDEKLAGIVTRSSLLSKPEKKVILVDHNEPSQAVDGIDDIEVIEIVDHHRISPIHTDKPITFINYPVGSTSTIIAIRYKENNINPDKKTAQLLMAGILSDTVILKSPTTTKYDHQMVKWLNKFAKINYKKFATEFFKAGARIDFKNISSIITGDFKTFDMKGNKVGIGQVETVGFENFLKYKNKFIRELDKLREKEKFVLIALLITDISQQSSLLIARGEERILKKLPYKKIDKNLYELKGVLSRKKQVVPLISRLFEEI